ncbi:PREDICTED: uncharacterized protein LOC104743913 [Camelina sativa]|uniref:Uncharacterized protein LOC104743913 n=1 Tax=Camelina sativa TaxID=90675 RepID=A0ABM0VYT9_CAMSA|nr:PREDICTED: uncharacterized protein LOC104743913 [Camelina sativa]
MYLAENFNKSSIARDFTLRRSLWVLEKKDMTFAAYCREFIANCDALSSIGKPIDESLKIFDFLNGLGRDYDPITTVVQSSLSKASPPSFGDVVSKVENFDTKLRSYDVSEFVTPHLAFQAQQTGNGNQSRGGYRGRGWSSGQNRVRGGYSSRGRGFSQHQSNPRASGERPICQICGRTGHIAFDCWNRFDKNYQRPDVAQVFSSLQVSDGNEWVTDSGATAHVTPSASNLQSATTYIGNDPVMVGDGAYLPITHVGSNTISSAAGKISLNNVLVCPDLQKSLVFVLKLCDGLPCGVWFDANKVCVVDIPTQKVVAKGPRNSGFYLLENQEFVALFSNRYCAASEGTGHHRLGHSN